MAKYKEYKCELCCYTVAVNPQGHDVVMMGEVYSYMCQNCWEIVNILASEKTVCPECGSEKLVKWNPIKGRCPKCGKKMKETGVIMMVD